MRGRVSSLQVVAQAGVMPIGSIVAGELMAGIGVRETMVLTGASAVLAGTVLLAFEGVTRSQTWVDADAPLSPAPV